MLELATASVKSYMTSLRRKELHYHDGRLERRIPHRRDQPARG
jgi:hypothetical protein